MLRGEKTEARSAFRAQENGSILGSKYHRPSALAKVTGTWDFGADVALQMPPDTLRLALVQAEGFPRQHQRHRSSEAEKMPGVVQGCHIKDVKGKNRITGLITFPTNKGDGWDRPILCEEKVFQFGDAIAIVCADTDEHARAAAEKVKVDLEVLPAYMSAPAAMAPDAHRDPPRARPMSTTSKVSMKGEDTKPLMEKAGACCRSGDLLQPSAPSAILSPIAACAYIDDRRRLTIHSKSIACTFITP